VFGHDGNNSYYAVVIDRAAGAIALHKVTSGSWGAALASDSATFYDNAEYAIWVYRKQRYIYAAAIDLGGPGGEAMAEFEYNSTADLRPGMFGAYADQTTCEFAVAKTYDGAARESLVPRFRGLAESSISWGAPGSGHARRAVLTLSTQPDEPLRTKNPVGRVYRDG
jgi:hypothetical protein